MMDPIAAGDQAVETIKGVARIHGAYFMRLIEEGLDREEAMAAMQTMIWILAERAQPQECDDDD